MDFSPNKQNFQNIWITALWTLLSGILWSIIIIIISFVISGSVDIVWTFKSANVWVQTSAIFPIILSVMTLVWTFMTTMLTYFLLNMLSPEKYKKNWVIFWQLAFFQIITFFFITPVYMYLSSIDSSTLLTIYVFHVIIIIFWTSLLVEILNNYRYILVWFYGSFVWLFLSMMFTVIIYYSFTTWYAKLIAMIILLPLINFLVNFFKQLFELLYYKYYLYSSLDQLWDIFYRIELEEKENLIEEEQKNTL